MADRPQRRQPAPISRRCGSGFERAARAAGHEYVAGLDEAGRGCLFGPVYAAAVILSPQQPLRGLNDSKQIAASERERLAKQIREHAVAWAVASVDAAEIDRINILQASRLAMKIALLRLDPPADYALVDALTLDVEIPQQALIKGDERCRSIAAASILAKVDRDAAMVNWDKIYPEYGFARNKGYGTPEHLRALERCGVTAEHRRGFAPVRAACGLPPLAKDRRQMTLFEEATAATCH